MKLFSQNVQSLRDLEQEEGKFKGPFPDLTFKSRWVKIEAFFQMLREEKQVELFALQEVGPEAESSFQQYFSSINYQCIFSKYCLHAGAQSFIFAFDPLKYQFISKEPLPYTTSGQFLSDIERQSMSLDDIKEHNLGVEYEKSAQVITLKELATGANIRIYNTHPGLFNAHRLACMDILATSISKDIEAEINVVVTGDMNQFDSDNPKPRLLEQQSERLERVGITWLDKRMIIESGARATFFAYPFDILRFLTKEDKGLVFGWIDEAKALRAYLKLAGQDLQSDEKLQSLYKQIRNFFIVKQRQLVCQDEDLGAGLSTVLDFLGVVGPYFGKKPEELHTVTPLTFYKGKLFDTAREIESRSGFEQEVIAHADDPLVSDHFGMLLSPK